MPAIAAFAAAQQPPTPADLRRIEVPAKRPGLFSEGLAGFYRSIAATR